MLKRPFVEVEFNYHFRQAYQEQWSTLSICCWSSNFSRSKPYQHLNHYDGNSRLLILAKPASIYRTSICFWSLHSYQPIAVIHCTVAKVIRNRAIQPSQLQSEAHKQLKIICRTRLRFDWSCIAETNQFHHCQNSPITHGISCFGSTGPYSWLINVRSSAPEIAMFS